VHFSQVCYDVIDVDHRVLFIFGLSIEVLSDDDHPRHQRILLMLLRVLGL